MNNFRPWLQQFLFKLGAENWWVGHLVALVYIAVAVLHLLQWPAYACNQRPLSGLQSVLQLSFCCRVCEVTILAVGCEVRKRIMAA